MQNIEPATTVEEVAAITDPGEANRANHNWGDRVIVHISNLFAWFFPILMIAICSQVVLRGIGMNQAWLDDLQWWLYGAAVLVGVGYAVTTNSHVRVDIFYDHYDERKKLRTEIFAIAWLFLPFIILCWDVTAAYAVASLVADEGSDSPNGLHNLWVLKIFMNLSFVFIAFACWSAYVRYLTRLTTPTLFRKLLYALPSTFFIINMIVFRLVWSFTWLTAEDGATSRDISRAPIFDAWEPGRYEIAYTALISVAVTLVVLIIARALQPKTEG
ncbi:TRAP transporter small permease subunit [Yoonia sp. 208BN28-4]|uniref:TRAP transporter small permease subunit n=1 Tax=Yoonia sp. 208BN28-4 TaxID=3126505 RepID=UPI003097C264